ncbi:MAG: rRNA maturation RNase YbeY [Candidatus Cloacimonetes bacterium]|jgi:probable rRNA maturation factor|nr:rRNA maturation RNase YbeY [Candidatus Cloacimonadota bacterium]MDD2506513.1 rRNA maturation RNase YbeY [Candidatus Cloacimonadota bacterium]MDD4147402.1 rRNA maturation RNase YbeY [Candidatus Cloacimonadota bacterium]MDD4559849.1 rRNA maturation RNase YbeY [Candidatus Cloacimonadota bacterium]
MTSVEVQGDLPPDISQEQISAIARRILAQEAAGVAFEISLLCTNDQEMQRINRIYRGMDTITDVLSFVGESLVLQGLETRYCDIIIDTNQVFLQKGKNTYKEEFWQVLIHALLHLAGYDHIRTADKKKMEDAEDNYRRQIPKGHDL